VAEPARPAEAARVHLAGALRTAMKAGDRVAVNTLRALLSALDNTSAVPLGAEHARIEGRVNEAPRHEATEAEITQVFAAEAEERRAAAADYRRRGLDAEAGRLDREAAIIAEVWPDAAAGLD
jgi:uncharacterized protein YqeY